MYDVDKMYGITRDNEQDQEPPVRPVKPDSQIGQAEQAAQEFAELFRQQGMDALRGTKCEGKFEPDFIGEGTVILGETPPQPEDEQDALPICTEREPRSRSALHHKVHNSKQVDKRGKLFGFRDFGVFAVDVMTVRKMMGSRTDMKPKWAVWALVWLRDMGECRLCKSQVHDKGRVKQLVPADLGGQFSEPNCVLVCKDCNLAWPGKNFFLSPLIELHFLDLALWVLRKRMMGKSGARGLGQRSLEHREELRQRRDKLVAATVKRIGQVVPTAQSADGPFSKLIV